MSIWTLRIILSVHLDTCHVMTGLSPLPRCKDCPYFIRVKDRAIFFSHHARKKQERSGDMRGLFPPAGSHGESWGMIRSHEELCAIGTCFACLLAWSESGHPRGSEARGGSPGEPRLFGYAPITSQGRILQEPLGIGGRETRRTLAPDRPSHETAHDWTPRPTGRKAKPGTIARARQGAPLSQPCRG